MSAQGQRVAGATSAGPGTNFSAVRACYAAQECCFRDPTDRLFLLHGSFGSIINSVSLSHPHRDESDGRVAA